MTKQQAFSAARRIANRKEEMAYVVWSVEDTDQPGQHYQSASEWDLDTFYCGAEIVASVDPDGEIEGAL